MSSHSNFSKLLIYNKETAVILTVESWRLGLAGK